MTLPVVLPAPLRLESRMARWRLYWLTMSATYTGVVAVAIAVHEPYQGVWFNVLVLLGPPVLGYVVGVIAERK